MSSFLTFLTLLVMGLVAIVLVRGLFNMARGGSGNTSNKLMQLRILLQAIAIILIMFTLWVTGGGRPS
ncbi:MAG: twin transmembrane helix small protein [Shinella sp.]|nr:twin transmembrane helix small protein [Shinella sp.]